MSHAKRPALDARPPALVTLKLVGGLPSLRCAGVRDLLHQAFRANGERPELRLVHFTIESNHIHALVEARDASSLARRMQGLCVRLARALNRVWQRTGRVFADRFHSRVLRTPREVRYALAYVLNNARKRGLRLLGIDSYSSGSAFDGWHEVRTASVRVPHSHAPPVQLARSWLLTRGWIRHGRIRISEVPGGSS